MESGDINNSQVSTLKLVTNFSQAGDVSFMFKTSTEGSYDFLFFNVNNTNINSWSGENSWTNYTYPVNAGSYTLRWKYTKDNVVSSGSDACWVDNIIMPPSTNTFVVEENEASDMQLFPNPTNGHCRVQFTGDYDRLVVIDAQGKWLTQENISLDPQNVIHNIHIETSDWAKGAYQIQLWGRHGKLTQPLIKW